MTTANRSFKQDSTVSVQAEIHPTSKIWFDKAFLLVTGGILGIFILRTLLAWLSQAPHINDLITAFVVVGSLVLLLREHRSLHKRDWVAALVVGGVVGVSMYYATLFSAYPFFGIVRSNAEQAFARGAYTTIAALGGLLVMRQGGPVRFSTASGGWRKVGASLVLGLVVGLPLAVLNVFALQMTEGKPISWQSPWAAMLDALQPGVVEEVIYRFALLGLLWLMLRKSQPARAGWLAGILATLAHTYMHFDDLFLQAPLVAFGMGLVMTVVWGVPELILALRRDLDSAIAFHWIQDVARFIAGF